RDVGVNLDAADAKAADQEPDEIDAFSDVDFVEAAKDLGIEFDLEPSDADELQEQEEQEDDMT
ncbi:unnamed protein product, partial [Amoebophrya sp. A25]